MRCHDFEYDGLNLGNMGFTVCRFGSEGLETLSNGAPVEFRTVSVLNGAKSELAGAGYGECLEATFQICKDPCANADMEITLDELRRVMGWLNRKGFHKLKLLELGYFDLYFEASFDSISRIEHDGRTYGLELHAVTNRPYALQEPRTVTFEATEENGSFSITDVSDEEGFIYPHTEILIKKDGDLAITNALESRSTVIRNCTEGEWIYMDYPVIRSSKPGTHKIQNDFNWNFFRIANTFKTGKNDITVSLPSKVAATYSPAVKLAL